MATGLERFAGIARGPLGSGIGKMVVVGETGQVGAVDCTRLASLAVSMSVLQYNCYDGSKVQSPRKVIIWGTRASISTKEQCAKDNTFRFALLDSDYKLSITY